MNPNSPYFKQVQLLVQALPVVAKQPCFALKGGTAINLFVRDLPRLSVDIDLAFLPIKGRDESLAEIQQAMLAIRAELEQRLALRVSTTVLKDSNTITRLVVNNRLSDGSSQIKIEVTPVLRGSVHPASMQSVMPSVEQQFGFAEIAMLDFNDLYAGKLCAALDRQHPRDLFDVQLLLANEGISEALKNTFLVYLISHGRPMAELLTSRPKPLAAVFDAEFFGMTTTPVTLESLQTAHQQLVTQLNSMLTDQDKAFLLAIKKGEPDWVSFYYPQARHLPAVRWRLHNIQHMDKAAQEKSLATLATVLNL